MKSIVKFIAESSYTDDEYDAMCDYLEGCGDLDDICLRGEPDTWEDLWDYMEKRGFDVKKLKNNNDFIEEVLTTANQYWIEDNNPFDRW